MEPLINDPFQKISSNLIGYVLQFLDLNDALKCISVNKKFSRALSADFLWENYVLQDDLFVPNERHLFKTWKEYFFFLSKLKTQMKSGKANISFKMKPMRGHKNIVTSMANYEVMTDSGIIASLFTGDKTGQILVWIINDDGDYEGKNVYKMEAEVFNLSFTYLNNFPVLVAFDLNASVCVINLTNLKVYRAFQVDVPSLYQVQVDKERIYVGPNFHNVPSIQQCDNVKSYDLVTGEKICEYQPSYNFQQMRLISEEAAKLKTSSAAKNYIGYNIPIDNPINSFLVQGSKLYIINNFDVDEHLLITRYSTVSLHNLFIFDTEKAAILKRIFIDLLFLLEVKAVKNHIAIIGLDKDYSLKVLFYTESQFTLAAASGFTFPAAYNQIMLTIHSIFSGNYMVNIWTTTSLYKLCSREKEGTLLFILQSPEIKEIGVNISESYTFGKDCAGKVINCVAFDKFKFCVAFSDNTIKVFSLKTKEMWYNLLGGSMTVVPKSFVAHPSIVGFSKILLTRFSIIGAIGNLIREYSFSPNISK